MGKSVSKTKNKASLSVKKTKKASPQRHKTSGRNRTSASKSGSFLSAWRKRSFIGKIFYLGMAGFVAVFIYIFWCYITLPALDDINAISRKPIVTVLDRNDTLVASYGEIYGDAVNLKDLPSYVPAAILATEDRRFFSHSGFDFKGILRALYVNLTSGRRAQGASTITQQVAKNIFLTFDKTVKRKIQEAILALWLERNLTKEQILTLYLNRVYLGSGTYGIDAAAKRYFNRPAHDLTLYQAAVLSGILKAPSRYNPSQHPEQAKKRAKLVLDKMVENKFISSAERKQALLSADNPIEKAPASNNRFFGDWVIALAEDFLGEIDRDITIKTTLDLNIQKITEKAVTESVNSWAQVKEGAAVVMDLDGAVLALMGGTNYNRSQFNRAVDARRQPASTVKPFVYLTAFEEGYSPYDVIEDKPVLIADWMPKNSDGKFHGKLSLSDALVLSVNTVPVILAEDIGIDEIIKTLRKFGVYNPKCAQNLSLALGTCEVSLLKLTGAYASLGNGGYPVIPFAIEEITDREGNSLYDHSSSFRSRLVAKDSLNHLKTILGKVITQGTGKDAYVNDEVYGKTGTSQNNRDAWFVGFSDDIAVGVWVGNDNEAPMPRVYGGNLPARIWRLIINNSSKY